MKFKINHDYHIHSQLSTCSNDPEQTPERILQYAKDNGLSRICLTDHYWDSAAGEASDWYRPQNFEHIRQAKPLPQAEGVEFLFGCEAELDQHMTLGVPPSRFDEFDFIIIPTTHMHMRFTVAEEDRDSNERRAALWVERLDRVLDMPLPFHKVGIAHLSTRLINRKSKEDFLETMRMIPSEEMERLFRKAAKLGCGIEINQSNMSFEEDEAEVRLRPFRIAKACGCKFYLGSDAHHPETFVRTREIFERAVDLLDLREEDQFYIGR